MKSARHHIRKQFMDFDFKTKSAALQWQQKVAFQNQQEYVKKIEAVLDKYDDGSCIEIDKIIIDIGTVREDEVALRIEEELDLVLKKLQRTYTIQHEIPTPQPISEPSKEVITRTQKEELLQAFLYFISQGHFPWYIKIDTVATLEEQLLDQFSVKDLTMVLKADEVLDKHRQKTRFFYQFSDAFVQEIARQYFKDEYSGLKGIAKFCETQFKKPFFKSQIIRNTKSEVTDDISRWILLFAPENKISWASEFVKWYITENCFPEILPSNEKLWTTLKDVKAEDNSQIAERYLKKLFTDLKAHVKGVTPRLGSSPKEDNEISHRSDTTENIDRHHVTDEQNDRLKVEGGAKAEKEIGKDEQSKTEASELSEKDTEATYAQESKIKLTSDDLVGFDGTDKELPPIEENDDGKENQTEHQTLHDKNRDKEVLKGPSGNRQELNVSQDSMEKQLPKSKAKEETISTESSDDSFDTKAAFEDSNNQLEFNDAKETGFYPTIEETIDTLLPPEKDFSKMEKNTSVLPPDSYYINDSGIVLVWPYLSRLFANLKYTKENQFISKRKQERAVLLLGYIASGKASCEEHKLVFSKFLCNWPFQMPVVHPFELTKKERKEVKAMLKGLIAHWSILKNTSIDGLRETFFWREGKLEEKEEYWKLVVEQKGTDILLNHLPYGISMIKLPWHKKMLRVDWA